MTRSTIYDVARHAGVSHQTVTRVLRGLEGIRPETRHKVETAIEALQYRPNLAARQLRARRIDRIGILVHAMGENGPSRTLAGAAIAAQRNDVVLDILPVDSNDPMSVRSAVSIVRKHQILGIVATALTVPLEDALKDAARGLPVSSKVTITPDGFDVSHDEAIGFLAADHLASRNHLHVGYIAGPSTWPSATGRASGFKRRIEALGGAVVLTENGDWSARSGFSAMSRLVNQPSKVEMTAVACANDSMAVGAIAALTDAGIKIPDKMAVVGTDDLPEVEHLRPSLTTVAIDFEGEGKRLVEDLLVRVGHLDPSARGLGPTPPRLIIRGSTAHKL